MKKIIKNFIKYLFIISLVFLSFSCKNNCRKQQHTHEFIEGVCNCGETEGKFFTVTFKNYDGTILKTDKVLEGKSATAPEAPTREGYIFEKWDIEFNNITEDLTVTAIFVEDVPASINNARFYSKSFSYDGKEKQITVEGRLPQGYTITYENNKATEIGSYYSTANIYNETGKLEKSLKAVFKIVKPDNQAFNDWLDDFLVLYFEEDQLSCNLLFANPEDFGLKHYEAIWLSYAPFTNEEAIVDFQEIYDELITFEESELSPQQQFSYDIIEDFCEYYIDYYSHDYNGLSLGYISSFGGRAADLPTYMTGYIFRNEQDVKDVISFIKSVKEAYPTYVEYAKDMIKIGRPISDTTIDEMNEYLQQVVDAGADYYLNKYFENKFATLDFLTKEQAEAYTLEIKEALQGDFIQAHADLKAELIKLKGNCTKEGYLASAGSIGKEYYVKLLKDNLGYSEINMDDYIAYLDKKITSANKGISNVMMAIKNFDDDNYQLFVDYVYGVKPFIEGKPEELLKYLKTFARTLVPNLSSNPEIHISYMDTTVANFSNAVAYYMNSPLDSFNHEYITFNPLHLDNKNDTLSTLAHEGYPGHLYSYVFAKESNIHNVNKVMKNLTFGEGWATYVQLMLFKYIKENTKDSVVKNACDYLYYNQLLSYLVYSRLDAGINYQGWKTTKVSSYMGSVGFPSDDETALELFNTLIEMPAEYPAYGFGMVKFLDLHTKAKSALGVNYNEIDFNREILSYGWVPMEKLEQIVENYIAEQKNLYEIK